MLKIIIFKAMKLFSFITKLKITKLNSNLKKMIIENIRARVWKKFIFGKLIDHCVIVNTSLYLYYTDKEPNY